MELPIHVHRSALEGYIGARMVAWLKGHIERGRTWNVDLQLSVLHVSESEGAGFKELEESGRMDGDVKPRCVRGERELKLTRTDLAQVEHVKIRNHIAPAIARLSHHTQLALANRQSRLRAAYLSATSYLWEG